MKQPGDLSGCFFMYILDNEIYSMVNLLKTKEKNFFDSYYAVRSVKNLGLRHRKQAGPDEQNSAL